MSPSDQLVSKVVKKVELNLREKFKHRRVAARELEKSCSSPLKRCCSKRKKGRESLDIKNLLKSSDEES